MKKTALIISGGGMNSVYTAGSLNAISKIPELESPDIIISASGSAGTSAYFVSKQHDEINNAWLNTIPESKLINFRRFWKILDIDFLIEEVLKKEIELDLEKLKKSNTDLFLSVVHWESGKIDYFSNRDKVNFFDVLKASYALPILSNERVTINGEEYCDGVCGVPYIHIEKAKKLGAEKIIILDNTHPRWYTNLWRLFYVMFRNRTFRKHYNNYRNFSKNFKGDTNIFLIKQSKDIRADLLTRDKSVLKKSFDKGFEDLNNKKEDILKFLRS